MLKDQPCKSRLDKLLPTAIASSEDQFLIDIDHDEVSLIGHICKKLSMIRTCT